MQTIEEFFRPQLVKQNGESFAVPRKDSTLEKSFSYNKPSQRMGFPNMNDPNPDH